MSVLTHGGSVRFSGRAASPGGSRAVGAWLFLVAAFVVAMVVVGGATRLTGSGLSITQWKPVSGALPPLSTGTWAEAFARYRATSQYRLVNHGISLAHFKVLFWWEWAHRLLARGVGAVFAIPLVGFIIARRLPARLISRCVGLFFLGGLQGLVGWWMVKSGLEGRIAVAPERLATHLGLALVLFAALIWTGLDAWFGDTSTDTRRRDGWTLAGALFAAGVFLQCLLGALVAGNSGGLVDADWPMMAGRLVPADYWQGGFWATIAHAPVATQFNHRLVAYSLFVAAVWLALMAWRSRVAGRDLARLWTLGCLVVIVQASLGVATLLTGVSLAMALLHQANATVLFGLAVIIAWRSRRAQGILIPSPKNAL